MLGGQFICSTKRSARPTLPDMKTRRRLLIAIERNELRFWTLTSRMLLSVRGRSRPADPRVNADLDAAIEWAADAERARREEIAYLSRLDDARDAAPRSAPRVKGIGYAA